MREEDGGELHGEFTTTMTALFATRDTGARPTVPLASSEATAAIVRRFVAGENDAAALYLARFKGTLLRAAERSIRRRRIDQADLDAEGAVDLAFGRICAASGPRRPRVDNG